jgi:hypothetical protein
VFDPLRRGNKRGASDSRFEVLIHHLFAFLDEPDHCRAAFAAGLFIHGPENLTQAIHMPLRLFEVLVDASAEFLRFRFFRTLRQGFQQAIFGVVQIS